MVIIIRNSALRVGRTGGEDVRIAGIEAGAALHQRLGPYRSGACDAAGRED